MAQKTHMYRGSILLKNGVCSYIRNLAHPSDTGWFSPFYAWQLRETNCFKSRSLTQHYLPSPVSGTTLFSSQSWRTREGSRDTWVRKSSAETTDPEATPTQRLHLGIFSLQEGTDTKHKNLSYLRRSNKATHFLNPKFFQSSLIFICNPGLFSASWWFLFWMLDGFLLSPLARAGTRGLILVVDRLSTELDLYSPGTWRVNAPFNTVLFKQLPLVNFELLSVQ